METIERFPIFSRGMPYIAVSHLAYIESSRNPLSRIAKTIYTSGIPSKVGDYDCP